MSCTTAKPFVDTSVLLCAYDLGAGERRKTAAALVSALWRRGGGILSTQVLQEFYVNVTRKTATPLPAAKARGIIEQYCTWQVEQNGCDTVLHATQIQDRHQLSFWDALIIAAAAQGGADMLLSEDLSPGQIIAGVCVVNPFAPDDPRIRALLDTGVGEAAGTAHGPKTG
jgi:predicted nucleic acid-binding protein